MTVASTTGAAGAAADDEKSKTTKTPSDSATAQKATLSDHLKTYWRDAKEAPKLIVLAFRPLFTIAPGMTLLYLVTPVIKTASMYSLRRLLNYDETRLQVTRLLSSPQLYELTVETFRTFHFEWSALWPRSTTSHLVETAAAMPLVATSMGNIGDVVATANTSVIPVKPGHSVKSIWRFIQSPLWRPVIIGCLVIPIGMMIGREVIDFCTRSYKTRYRRFMSLRMQMIMLEKEAEEDCQGRDDSKLRTLASRPDSYEIPLVAAESFVRQSELAWSLAENCATLVFGVATTSSANASSSLTALAIVLAIQIQLERMQRYMWKQDMARWLAPPSQAARELTHCNRILRTSHYKMDVILLGLAPFYIQQFKRLSEQVAVETQPKEMASVLRRLSNSVMHKFIDTSCLIILYISMCRRTPKLEVLLDTLPSTQRMIENSGVCVVEMFSNMDSLKKTFGQVRLYDEFMRARGPLAVTDKSVHVPAGVPERIELDISKTEMEDDFDKTASVPTEGMAASSDIVGNDKPVPESSTVNKWGFEIRFENVSFRYPNKTVDAITDMSFTIRSGETVSLVGVNGAGKSTVVMLLLRLYRPTRGRITFNGVDSSTLNSTEFFNQISAVLQKPRIFPGTVGRNIGVGRVLTSLDNAKNIEWASRKAGAHSWISKLKTTNGDAGYQVTIDEGDGHDNNEAESQANRSTEDLCELFGIEKPAGGVSAPIRLSGGQEQAVTVARGFLRTKEIFADAPILNEEVTSTSAQAETSHIEGAVKSVLEYPVRLMILDEPAASLDSLAEYRILKQFVRLTHGNINDNAEIDQESDSVQLQIRNLRHSLSIIDPGLLSKSVESPVSTNATSTDAKIIVPDNSLAQVSADTSTRRQAKSAVASQTQTTLRYIPTSILITHRLAPIQYIADRIIVIGHPREQPKSVPETQAQASAPVVLPAATEAADIATAKILHQGVASSAIETTANVVKQGG